MKRKHHDLKVWHLGIDQYFICQAQCPYYFDQQQAKTMTSPVSRLSGFTLIELLIVLVLIGLAGSMVAPNLWTAYEKAHERKTVQDIAASIQDLRLKAFHSGKSILLPAVSSAEHAPPHWPGAWPSGWQLESSTAIQLLPTGVTSGGSMRLRSPGGRQWLLELSPLDGKVSIQRQ